MMNSKRGNIEEVRLLMYGVFSMILFLLGIFIVYDYMSGLEYDIDFKTKKLEFDTRAFEMTSNPACLAWQDAEGRVHPGVIDETKFTELIKGERSSCGLDNYKVIRYKYELDGTMRAIGHAEKTGTASDDPFEIYLVKVIDQSRGTSHNAALFVQMK